MHGLEVERDFVDDVLAQPPFAKQHRFDPLHKVSNIHRVRLAESMAAIRCLVLH